jgi:hypothetical protein
MLLTTVCANTTHDTERSTDAAAREAVDYVWAVTMAGRRPESD